MKATKYLDPKKAGWIERQGYTAQIYFDFKEPGNNSRLVLIRLDAKKRIEPHHHTKIREIAYIVRGKGTFIVGDKHHHMKENDMMLIEPNETHEMINESDEPFEWLEFKMHDPKENDLFFSDEDKAQ